MDGDLPDGRAGMTARPVAPDGMARRSFVLDNTALLPVPLCPEILLHVADEALALWQRTEQELDEIGLPAPFWAFAWAGGQALARHVLDHRDTVAGRHVLDLGAGSGLVGIAAMRAGAASVTAIDPDPWAIAAIGLNAAANGVNVTAVEGDGLDGEASGFDVVLIGDLFYEQPLAERLLAFVERAHRGGAAILIGDPGRSYLPRHRLVRLAEYSVPTTRALEDSEIKRTAVWSPGWPAR
ncbi:class I SAM-dependent methyltransferase [Tepidamorphus gemmatus]|nr:methyltransferase [Tepidamorphus gemmatus]